jgi:hypothetical protein
MFFGGGSALVLAFSDASREAGLVFQVLLAFSSIVTLVAAFAVWQYQRWGAYLYLAIIVVGQIMLARLGLWTWGTSVVPAIILLLLFLGFRRLVNAADHSNIRTGADSVN